MRQKYQTTYKNKKIKLALHFLTKLVNSKIQSKIPLKKVRPRILYSAKLSFKHGDY